MTLVEAKGLELGQVIYHMTYKNVDGSPERWRVNGKVKTWKRDPNEVQVPIKYGMFGYGYITESTLGDFSVSKSGVLK